MRLSRRSTAWKARTDNSRKDSRRNRLSKRFVKKLTDCAYTEPASLRKQKSPSPEHFGEGDFVKLKSLFVAQLVFYFFNRRQGRLKVFRQYRICRWAGCSLQASIVQRCCPCFCISASRLSDCLAPFSVCGW